MKIKIVKSILLGTALAVSFFAQSALAITTTPENFFNCVKDTFNRDYSFEMLGCHWDLDYTNPNYYTWRMHDTCNITFTICPKSWNGTNCLVDNINYGQACTPPSPPIFDSTSLSSTASGSAAIVHGKARIVVGKEKIDALIAKHGASSQR